MKKLPAILVLVIVVAVLGYYLLSEQGKDEIALTANSSTQIAQIDEKVVDQSESSQKTEIVKTEVTEEHAHDETHEHEVQEYVAGKHYVVIDRPVETQTGDKVEVRELFWYYCGHCYNLEPYIHAMEATLTDEAVFVRQPSVLGDSWINGAIFYYVLKDLGELDRLHAPLFDAIHKHKIKFNSQEEFVNWLSDNGVDKEKANTIFTSFSVESNVRKAIADTRKYQSRGVPTLVVNGKYWVDAMHAGSIEGIFKVVDYLIEKELH